MTTIYVTCESIEAVGHAGDRDICIAVTWSLRTLAHALSVFGLLRDVEQTEHPPVFRATYGAGAQLLVDEVVIMFRQLSKTKPGHIRIARKKHAARHVGDRLSSG